MQKKKTKIEPQSSSATNEITKFIQGQQNASEEIEQAMYIQFEEQEFERRKDSRRMKLVK